MEMPPEKRHNIITWSLIAIGWISVFLGVLGIFLPLLPTTPFLLLAAACFVRSSPRFYQWLVEHPKLGKYILHYLNGEGLPKKAKIYTIMTIWLTMGISAWLVVPIIWGKLALLLIGGCVSIYIWRLPTITDSSVTKPQHDGS
ncbi:YbaN family protein [Bermanella sp. WJH001]|uniref:YbaN family protein n=1 Tax=Bermanella sp. WJH001 TaxID=3048005 RepID=UPI0024BDBF76|nr:YbaN family protein [Bermanella sp. WJH001]MDJ1536621.1 YbaN family protein [Bermanella sp. WJH001]